MPTDAIVGGFDLDKKPLHICRYKVESGLIPGNANTQRGCSLAYGGNEVQIKKETFEVLVGNNIEWVPRHGTDPLPRNAFICGYKSKGDPIYIGRCALHDIKGDSKIIVTIDDDFFYPYVWTQQLDCTNHEVLVCNQ
jgi:hypothetical protein